MLVFRPAWHGARAYMWRMLRALSMVIDGAVTIASLGLIATDLRYFCEAEYNAAAWQHKDKN